MSKLSTSPSTVVESLLFMGVAMGATAQISWAAPLKSALSLAQKPIFKAPRMTQPFSPIETSFQIADFVGDPFDFTKNDVRAEIRLPDGKILSLPAFFDGGQTWRVRHTPGAAGKYEVVALRRNGQKLTARANPQFWDVKTPTQNQSARAEAGFVRIDTRNPRRLSFESGARYYPLGTNQAWMAGKAGEYDARFRAMKASGQNWSRIWMNHWDGKNFDWGNSGKIVEPGQIDLGVARRWDEILAAAERNGIYFQLIFQHHGQYSTKVNSPMPAKTKTGTSSRRGTAK